MKKIIVAAVLALAVVSCNKTTEAAAVKTAYVDTSKLMDEYTKAKDLIAKYKAKEDALKNELMPEAARLQNEEATFNQRAQANGLVWAQQNARELQGRMQQFARTREQKMRDLEMESNNEFDTLVKSVKQFIKDYGKENGFDYIYGSGDNATILYSKDKYDITKEIIKLLNDKYASEGKKDETAPAAK